MRPQEYISGELNPRFLFTCKGIRVRSEEKSHKHDDFMELAFIMSGRGTYRINSQLYTVAEGDVIMISPGAYHQALVVDQESPTVEFFIGFCGIKLHTLNDNDINLMHYPILHTYGEVRRKLFMICSSMAAEEEGLRPERYHIMKAYLMQIIVSVIREQAAIMEPEQEEDLVKTVRKNGVVVQILNYFEAHYNEKVSLEQIAENMYVSPFYISKIFKSETGDTPIRHLINIRLERAKEIIEGDRQRSIKEIAADVGYDDVYHFSKLFKKKYGVAPSKLKKAQ